MRLKTYIINLEKSTVRRQYMQDLLSKFEFLDLEFIKAIDGRSLSDEALHSRFDFKRSRALYGKTMNAGEIGCVLSHRKVYQELLDSEDPYALVLEDDISVVRDLNLLDLEAVDKIANSDRPRILLLSGDYSYFKRRTPVVRVYAANGAYAYIINREAAKRIFSVSAPSNLADDWKFYKRKGVKLFAVYPYMIDANTNMELLGSDVKQDIWSIDRSKMAVSEVIIQACTSFIERMFRVFNHYEYKIRIYNNEIVERLKNPFR